MHVLRFENKLNEEVCRGFMFANLFNSPANLATNFQDLVAKVKNLVALAPLLGAISRPVRIYIHTHTHAHTHTHTYIYAYKKFKFFRGVNRQ